MPPQISVVHQT